jgi:acyl carrier protein
MNSIIQALKKIRPDVDFSKSKDFIKDQLLDSLDILALVSFLEERFGIVIDGEDVTHENFKSLRALEKFVQKYIGRSL